ncbi:MAG: hypothetical protein LUD55_08005 [Oscillospiraceae bacterium]|nr:hypothetical protein [Oscillospiraceae bacterium]
MGKIYSGFGLERTPVGYCENGKVYRGSGSGCQPIGEYGGGGIYRGLGANRVRIGSYDQRYIYHGEGVARAQVGEYDKNCIYQSVDWQHCAPAEAGGYHGMLWEHRQVGEYEGTGDEAAAGAMLLLLI